MSNTDIENSNEQVDTTLQQENNETGAAQTAPVLHTPREIVEVAFDDTQLHAIELALDTKKRLVGITGAAGTGKTTIIRKTAQELSGAGYRVMAVAPTGRAARRIREATGLDAMTIHAALEYPHPGERDPKTGNALRMGYPKRHEDYPLEADVVLADEYAMVNHEVHRNLIAALPRGGILRCFGDINQLPPIEQLMALKAESPFMKVLAQFPSVRLERIHRQGEGSGIIAAAQDILKNRAPSRSEDFVIAVTKEPVNKVASFVTWALEQGDNFASLNAQIICPTKKGWTGTTKLNALLQGLLNPSMKDFVVLPRHAWAEDKDTRVAVGDKVIWTQNNYTLELMNGEIGIVTSTNPEYGEITVDWGDRVMTIPPTMMVVNKEGAVVSVDPRKDLDLAYAITTHKAQGSEFAHVCYLLNKSSVFMQCRSNFYTAVTRASKKVTLITDQESLFASLRPKSLAEMKGNTK